MKGKQAAVRLISALALLTALAGCPGTGTIDPTGYTISGMISGLSGQLVLKLSGGTVNGSNTLVSVRNGPFSYRATITDPAAFAVSLERYPTVQSAAIVNPGSLSGASFEGIRIELHDLYFFAADDGSGRALWKSDGTASGTVKVRSFTDVFAFPNGSGDSSVYLPSPVEPTVYGGFVYFSAQDTKGSYELWKSGGTEESTVMLTSSSISPVYPAASTRRLYFGSNGTSQELWVSDGTVAGTAALPDLSGASVKTPSHLLGVGEAVYLFAIAKDGSGYGLWRSLGAGAPEQLVDLYDQAGADYPQYLAYAGGRLFFSAQDSAYIPRLWSFDPAQPASSSNPLRLGTGGGLEDPSGLTAAGTVLYFSARDSSGNYSLWKVDGTGEPARVASFASTYPLAGLAAVDGALYFAADDVGYAGMNALWRSDGSSAATELLSNSTLDFGSNPHLLQAVGNILLFAATDSLHGCELWAFDTSKPKGDSNPYLVTDINPGNGDGITSGYVS